MNTYVQKTFVVAVLVVLGMFYTASAVPLWDVNFKHMATNAPPLIAAAVGGIVNTNPTALGIVGSSNTVVVQDSFVAGSAVLADRPLVWTQVRLVDQPSGTSTSAIILDLNNLTDYESPADYFLEFDLLVRSNPTSHPISIQINSSSKLLFSVYFDKNTGLIFSSSGIGYPYVSYPTFANAWKYEEANHIRIYFNALEGSFTLKNNGKMLGSVYIADWGAVPSTEKGIRQVTFASFTKNASTTLALDNISSLSLPSGTLISIE